MLSIIREQLLEMIESPILSMIVHFWPQLRINVWYGWCSAIHKSAAVNEVWLVGKWVKIEEAFLWVRCFFFKTYKAVSDEQKREN